jgi:MFS family permease
METGVSAQKKPTWLARLLINRQFALLWSGQSISYLGDYVFDTTLLLWIAASLARGQSWGPLAVSGLLAATALPALLIGPIAGVFVDRWDKRRTMLWADALRAGLIASLLLATNIVPLPFLPGGRPSVAWQLGMIYTVVALENACSQFFGPSRQALIRDIVEEPQRARAIGFLHTTMNLALILGPSLAIPLFLGLGARWALMINALSFVVSFLAIWKMRVPPAARSVAPGQRPHFLREFAEGLRFYRHNQVLVTLLICGVLFVAGGGFIGALTVFFVASNLHAPVSFYGLLMSAYGAGVVAGSTLAALFAQRVKVTRTFWLAMISWGLLAMIFARLTSFPLAVPIFFLLGVCNAGVVVVLVPLRLQVTPRELVGRASAIDSPVIMLSSLLATSLAGYVESVVLRNFHTALWGMRFASVDTLLLGAGVLVVLGGLYAMVNLRHLPPARQDVDQPAKPAEVVGATSSD